jgi:AAA15 family ATPase/GTPase
MLLEFRFKNFKSFKDEAILTFIASKDKFLPGNLAKCPDDGSMRIVRSAIVYGANAAGKSTIVEAFSFVRNLIRRSAKNSPDDVIAVQPFLLDESYKNKPSVFEFTFVRKEIRYQYGFAISAQAIQSEWLISYPKGRPRKLFDRQMTKEGVKYSFSSFLKGEKDKLVELTHNNALFLSIGATFNNADLLEPYRWFVDQTGFISAGEINEARVFRIVAKDPEIGNKMKSLLKFADLGIVDMSLIEQDISSDLPIGEFPDRVKKALEDFKAALDDFAKTSKSGERKTYKVRLSHLSGNKQFTLPWETESEGTRRFFAMTVPILNALDTGRTVFIDELDRSLHPLLVRELIKMFQNPKINTKGAQLIFNTHDTSLLSAGLFRRDQVWFLEKDQTGASHLYSLLDFSPRKEEALERGYLQGRYGAVPFLGELPFAENDLVKEK